MKTISACLIVIIYLIFPDPGIADSISPSTRVKNELRVRKQPNVDSEQIGSLTRTEKAEVIGLLPNWFKVRLATGRIGFVHKAYVEVFTDDASRAADIAQKLELHFIDVGQGDSTLIVCPNGNTVLIDAGSAADGSPERVRRYILSQLDRHERKIDALVITHPDIDHYNYIPDVTDGVEVRKVFRTGASEITEYRDVTFQAWLKSVPARKQRLLYEDDRDKPTTPNKDINCGLAKIYILAAGTPSEIKKDNFINNTLSIVTMIRYGNFEAILTGDATTETEKVIIQNYPANWLKSKVLKVGHHGSKVTSTSKVWADTVKPEVAITSSGPENSHGHPSGEVIERLEEYTIRWPEHPMSYATGKRGGYDWHQSTDYEEAIFSTASSGDIVITTNGTTYDVEVVP